MRHQQLRPLKGIGLGLAFFVGTTFGIQAAEVRIATSLAISSIDPHFYNASPNNAMAQHFFDALVHFDANQQPVPGLAESWKAIDDTTWEFKLRRGVKFHDGSDFTAEDVLFTLKRAANVPNSPSSFSLYIKHVAAAEAIDPYTVRMRTAGPVPLLPVYMATFTIVSKKHGEAATTADYNSGKALVGTGPYKYVDYVPDDRIVMARNPDYWGGAEPWDTVTLRMIKNEASRVSALLAGDVDVIDNVPPTDLARVKADAKLSVARFPSNQVMYLHLDSDRAVTPNITDKAGKPIDNPFRKVDVRQAIGKAINREAIVERINQGVGVPIGQLMSEGTSGYSKALGVQAYDPDGARKLLAGAGYPNGFVLTFHSPTGRYVNDTRIAQAIAQMWARIGIDTKVTLVPPNLLFPQANALAYTIYLATGSSFTGEAGTLAYSLLGTYDKETSRGATNRGRYSNPEVDRLLGEALNTIDDAKRSALIAQAQEIAIGRDAGLLPLFIQENVWASTRRIRYEPHVLPVVFAMSVRPAE